MIGGASFWGGRFRATGVTALFVALLGGCGGEPREPYPVRTDRLVIGVPEVEPAGYPPLGRQDEAIAALDSLPGGKTLDPAELPVGVRAALQVSLDGQFGTPAAPTVPGDAGRVPGVSLSPEVLKRGSEVYAQACVNCHGVTGNGRGFGVGFAYPLPRDYRTGQFKCADGAPKPTADRLKRVLRQGVPGTQMQMVDLLPDSDIDALVAYVIHLSVRGECEARVLREALNPEVELTAAEVPSEVAGQREKALNQWASAVPGAAVDELAPTAEAMRRGAELFMGKGACVACHGAGGEGGKFRYDVWGQVGRTGNLTLKSSEYKWGGQATDITGHVRGGIAAARMPAAGLSEPEVADLVAFIRGLARGALPAGARERLNRRAD